MGTLHNRVKWKLKRNLRTYHSFKNLEVKCLTRFAENRGERSMSKGLKEHVQLRCIMCL
ncbi:hypothetical protein Peur_055199 [Populus x canadensis]